jgi:hypothetical protein
VAQRQVKVGNISKVGEVNIAAGDITKGFTAGQVSVLLTQITSTFQAKPFDGRCPYKGLDVFEEEDAELFFGREKLVADLFSRVKESRSIFITGPSGSGKSSLIRAGLIPALKQGAVRNSERWLYETIKPGRDPIEAIALSFSRLKSPELANYIRQHATETNILHECAESVLSGRRDQRLILFIDQFEEVFTQVSKEKAGAFLNLLTNAVTIENGRVSILFAMRSDFIPNCAAYPQINSLLNQQFVQIGAMQPNELVSAIAQPALRVGLRIDPDLIAQIIKDMQGEPGTLPLMQFALKDLFDAEQAKGGLIALKINDYLQRGGIHKALERHADAEFNKLSKTERMLAENLFKGLVEVGHNIQGTRRIARFEEFASSQTDSNTFESIVRRMADARLISTDESQAAGRTVTLAHEKLIEAWPWLKQLVNNNREFIQLQNQIIEDAIEWEKHGKDKSYLYAGARLITIQKKMHSFQINNEKAKIFLRAGLKAYHRNRFQRSLIVGLLLVMGVVIYFVVIPPLIEDHLNLQQVDVGGAGVNTLQLLSDGTIYAGMFNNPIKSGAPCLALLASGTSQWEKFGPTCTTAVAALWINPADPTQMYFAQSDDIGLYRSLDGGREWGMVGTGGDLPMTDIGSLTGTPEGSLFVGDFKSAVGVYMSSDQGNTWAPLDGSPNITVWTLIWVPQKGLLVGGSGGLWLWMPNGEWQQLIALDVSVKEQRILSVMVLPAERFTILVGGDGGIYLWKEGDPPQRVPQNDIIRKAWSLVLVRKPEPYVVALTFPDSKIWRMSLKGENPTVMKAVGSDGFPLIVQNEDPLRLWVGTVEGLFSGEFQNRASELTNSNK